MSYIVQAGHTKDWGGSNPKIGDNSGPTRVLSETLTQQAKGSLYHVGRGRNSFCTPRCKASFEKDPEKYLKVMEGDFTSERKVAIVGAGHVGATFAFALMISGLATSIVLIDLSPERAEGHVMDLNHGLSFVQPSAIYVGDYSDCKDANIVVVTAGAGQKPGETWTVKTCCRRQLYRGTSELI